MKKAALALLIIAPIQATDFTSRFGPNSPVYNQPLYFSAQHMIARPEKKNKLKKYRDALKKKKFSSRKIRLADNRDNSLLD